MNRKLVPLVYYMVQAERTECWVPDRERRFVSPYILSPRGNLLIGMRLAWWN